MLIIVERRYILSRSKALQWPFNGYIIIDIIANTEVYRYLLVRDRVGISKVSFSVKSRSDRSLFHLLISDLKSSSFSVRSYLYVSLSLSADSSFMDSKREDVRFLPWKWSELSFKRSLNTGNQERYNTRLACSTES